MNQRKLGLDDAYAVATPDDNRALYRDWAETYDREFIAGHGYIYHEGVIGLFAERAQSIQLESHTPILDVGCGTGAAGISLVEAGFTTVDGIDLSPEMLAIANSKGMYRVLAEADVTQPIGFDTGAYGGLVSVGTFTHGHLGPEPLPELVRVVAGDGLICLGINGEHFVSDGFEQALHQLESDGTIHSLRVEQIPMYDPDRGTNPDARHADDVAAVAIFQRRN